MISMNLHRRHLNESQRAMVAKRLATLRVGQGKANAPIGASSQDEAADMLHVSRRAVQHAAGHLSCPSRSRCFGSEVRVFS